MRKKSIPTHYAMAFLVLVISLLSIFFTEKVELSNGHNWDGLYYEAWAKDFHQEIFVKGLNDYWVQRIFPSMVVHYSLRLFHLPLEEQNIILGFGLWNLGLLVISAYLWGLIADRLNLTHRGKWLGFCGLFVNFAILKMNFYYPILTDTTAFALGLMSFYFYLSHRPKALLISALAGAFTWPTIFSFGLLLFLFSDWDHPKEKALVKRSKHGWLGASFMTLLVLGLIIKIMVKTHYFVQLTKTHVYQPPTLSVLNLSIALVLGYTFFAYYYLFNASTLSFKEIWARFNIKRFLVVLVCWFLVRWMIRHLAVAEHIVTTIRFVYRNITLGISKPLIWWVAHVVYYGPMVILTTFLWRSFCKAIQPYGVGLVLMVTAGIFLSIGSESRQMINFLPVFVAFTCKVIDSLSWKSSYYWLIGILSLVCSKVWLVINPLGPDLGRVLFFPYQKYYMNHGPFMSDIMYTIQAIVVLFTAVALYFVLFRSSPPEN